MHLYSTHNVLAESDVAGLTSGRYAAVWEPWTSCSHPCTFVTKQYNLALAWPLGRLWQCVGGLALLPYVWVVFAFTASSGPWKRRWAGRSFHFCGSQSCERALL